VIGTRALHLIARAAVRVLPPADAKRLVDRAARLLPPFRSFDEGRRAAAGIAGEGSCLTRALAVAARLPGSQVVIASTAPSRFAAHAWVERDGARIDEDSADMVAQTELVRLG
jgi:hypothetical protein